MIRVKHYALKIMEIYNVKMLYWLLLGDEVTGSVLFL